VAGAAIECHGAPFVPGSTGAAAVRPHDITLRASAPATANSNSVGGTVLRNVFLGSTRDYLVEVRDGTQLRVTTTPDVDHAPGTPVALFLPRERCRALAG